MTRSARRRRWAGGSAGGNVGFARGNNAGAAALGGGAYLFVNSDAFVHRPGSVGRLVDALAAPGVGVAVPRLLNEDLTLQPSVVPTSSPLPELVRASGLSRFVPNRLQPALGTHWDHSESLDLSDEGLMADLQKRGKARGAADLVLDADPAKGKHKH